MPTQPTIHPSAIASSSPSGISKSSTPSKLPSILAQSGPWLAIAATLQALQRDRYLKKVPGKMPEFWYRPTEIGLAECDRKTKRQAQITKSKTTKTK